jgi:hypothetical protein
MVSRPMLIANSSQLGKSGAMIQKVADHGTHREPELSLSSVGDGPDPRLVELVRLLARRAARRWFEETKAESGSKDS